MVVVPSPSAPSESEPPAYAVAGALSAVPVSCKPIVAAAPNAFAADVLEARAEVAGEVPATCTPGRYRLDPVVALPGTAAASNAATIIKINKLDRENVRIITTTTPPHDWSTGQFARNAINVAEQDARVQARCKGLTVLMGLGCRLQILVLAQI